MFVLDERLKRDCAQICKLKLSRVLLMNDRTVPWLVLVPERKGVREVCELSEADAAELMREIVLVSRVLRGVFVPDKINVGALGNIVTQLHLHVVGRYKNDRAWPAPVWGAPGAAPYTAEALSETVEKLRLALDTGR